MIYFGAEGVCISASTLEANGRMSTTLSLCSRPIGASIVKDKEVHHEGCHDATANLFRCEDVVKMNTLVMSGLEPTCVSWRPMTPSTAEFFPSTGSLAGRIAGRATARPETGACCACRSR